MTEKLPHEMNDRDREEAKAIADLNIAPLLPPGLGFGKPKSDLPRLDDWRHLTTRPD